MQSIEWFCRLPPKSLWALLRKWPFIFPLSQWVLIALLEWEMGSKVPSKENNKSPSWEYSGGSGLMRVKLFHLDFARMLVYLWSYNSNFIISIVSLNPREWESMDRATPVYQHCWQCPIIKYVQYNCTIDDGADQYLFIYRETTLQHPPKKWEEKPHVTKFRSYVKTCKYALSH